MMQQRKPLPTLTDKEKYLGLAYLVFQFAFLPTLLQLVGQAFSLSENLALYNFLYFTINFIAVAVIFSKLLKRMLIRIRRAPKDFLVSAALGLGVYWLCTWLLSAAIQGLLPDFSNLNDSSLIRIFAEHPILLFLGTVILAPVAEELLHRGLIFGWLYEKSIPLAYILSTLLFALIHVAQFIGVYSPLHVVVALVQYLPAGAVFAWAYARSGNLLAPIAIHAANNLLAILIVR